MFKQNPKIAFLLIAGTLSPVVLAQTPPQNPNPGDPGEETPATHRSIPLRLGSADAVQGELSLRVPLGPKLPGRVSLGFVWAFDSQNPLQINYSYGGGDFRPVIWPSGSAKRISFTVLVNGEAWSFPQNYTVTNLSVSSIMSNRSIDDGQSQANSEGSAYNLQTSGSIQSEVHASPDGRRYFVKTWWKMANKTTGTLGNTIGGRRMFILDGDNTIWTNLRGVSHFTTTWGDHITVTETGITNPPAPNGSNVYPNWTPNPINGGTIVIRNERNTAQSISLAVNSKTLKVTNTLGLPSATLNATANSGWRYVKRTYRDVTPVYDLTNPESIFDVCFLPANLQVTGDTTITTTFGWTPAAAMGGQDAPPLKSIAHPSGLKETFEYGTTPLKKLGDYAFHPDTGTWVGFRPSSNLVYASMQYIPITKITQSDGSKGSTVVISRVTPDWTENANPLGVVWNQKAHTTTIQSYPRLSPSGTCRTVKLTHPSYTGSTSDGIWGNPSRASESEMQAAYLFANGVVQKAELLDESGTTYKTAAFGGWDLRSYINPNGTIASGGVALAIPTTASPTAVLVDAPGLPQQVRTQRDWDTFTYKTGHGGANIPGVANGTTFINSWGSTANAFASSVDTAGQTTWSWRANFSFQPLRVTKILTGSQLPSLRQGATSPLALGTTDYGYDSLQRVTSVTTQVGNGFTKESRVYTGTNPQPDSVTQWAGIGTTLATATPLNFAGKTGKTYTYYAGPDYLLKSETDMLTGLTTSTERDNLGRVTKTTDSNGIVTTTDYDGWGRVWHVTQLAKGAAGAITRTYTYDDAGTWAKTVVYAAKENKTLTSWTYFDAFGRVVKEVAADGGTRTTTYSGYGEKSTQSPWLRPGQTAYGDFVFTYDGKGRLTKTTDPKGRTLSSAPNDPAWDATLGGMATTTLDDRGYSRTTVTDLLGQQKSLKDPKGKIATYLYDLYGRMSQMSLEGQIRKYAYDALGHLVSRLEPEEGETTYSQFTMSGAPGTTLQKGISGTRQVSIQTVFDAKGRASQISDPFGKTFVRTIQYDATFPDRVFDIQESQADGVVRETYGYDDLGRLSTKAVKDDYSQIFSLSRTLDSMGNTASLTYPTTSSYVGATVAFGSDAYFRPDKITKGTANRATMAYDQVATTSVANTLTFGNAAKTVRTLAKGELTQISHTVGTLTEAITMTWTAGGLLTVRGGDIFGYDELGHLNATKTVGLNGEIHTQNFTYDPFGNRTGSIVATTGLGVTPDESLSWTASYGTNNQLPNSVSSPTGPLPTGAQYDDFGRLIQVWAIPGQDSSFSEWIYDTSGRMTMEKGVRFLLDAQGLRFRRTKPDGTIQYTIYGFNRDPLSTFDSSLAALTALAAVKAGGPMPETEANTRGTGRGRSSRIMRDARVQYGKMKIPPPQVKEPQKYVEAPSEDEGGDSGAPSDPPLIHWIQPTER